MHNVGLMRLAIAYRVDIGSGTAEIDGQELSQPSSVLGAVTEQVAGIEYSQRGRDDLVVSSLLSLGEPLRLDDTINEELHDALLGGSDVEGVEVRHHVLRDHKGLARLCEDTCHLFLSSFIPRHDGREVPRDPTDDLRIVDDILHVASIGTPAEEEEVGIESLNLLCLGVGDLVGVGLHHLGTRTGCCHTCCLGGEVGDQATGHHLKSSRRTAAAEEFIRCPLLADLFL